MDRKRREWAEATLFDAYVVLVVWCFLVAMALHALDWALAKIEGRI
jgi:hypothetical protein